MSREDLCVKVDELEDGADDNSLKIEVFRIFLQQPRQIGSCADRCRTLNINDPDHQRTFLTSVNRGIVDLKRKHGFQKHSAIDSAFHEAWEIFCAQ